MAWTVREGAGPDLRLKLLWLSVFRMIATTLMLGALALRLFSATEYKEPTSEDYLSFFVVACVYLLTLIYALLLRRGSIGEWAAYVQLVGDVALATSLVYLTGGPESPFTFSYLIAVLAGAILLFQQGALLTAMVSATAFGGLILALQTGALKLPAGGVILPPGRLAFVVVTNFLAQFLIAVLAGYLSRLLLTTRGRLTARESDYRQLAKFQKQILASMPSGLVTCDSDGVTTFINRAAEAILGVDGTEWIGGPLDGLLPGVRAMRLDIKRNTVEAPTPAGSRILGLSLSALDAPEGGRLIVFQDLTQLRRVEDELKHADQLAALGRLAAQLAHEIRNPLAAMRGSAQMISAQQDSGTSGRLANILVRESDRLSSLLEDFLRFARPPTPNTRSTQLNEIVAETLEMLRLDPIAERVSIQNDLEEIRTTVDPDQIRQVLVNLVRNAMTAAGRGGQVRVSVGQSSDTAQIRVWDSGGSIPRENIGRIFEPFFTTRAGGTGLGLSAAHSIVRAHGGSIRVTSSPEHGTEFIIMLPQSSEAAVANPGGR